MCQGWRKQGTWPPLYPLQDVDIMTIKQIIIILRPNNIDDTDCNDDCDDNNYNTNKNKSTCFFLWVSQNSIWFDRLEFLYMITIMKHISVQEIIIFRMVNCDKLSCDDVHFVQVLSKLFALTNHTSATCVLSWFINLCSRGLQTQFSLYFVDWLVAYWMMCCIVMLACTVLLFYPNHFYWCVLPYVYYYWCNSRAPVAGHWNSSKNSVHAHVHCDNRAAWSAGLGTQDN